MVLPLPGSKAEVATNCPAEHEPLVPFQVWLPEYW